jgi:hypothetical protein
MEGMTKKNDDDQAISNDHHWHCVRSECVAMHPPKGGTPPRRNPTAQDTRSSA